MSGLWLAVGMWFGALGAPPDRSQAPDVPALAAPSFPVPTEHSLDDGTPVWIVERHGVPLVRISVALRAGWLGAADPLAARLVGALLDDGTRRQDAIAWSDALSDLGAIASLGVGPGHIWADVDAIAGTEAAAMALVREALLAPGFRRAEVRRVRDNWVRRRRDAHQVRGRVAATALNRLVYSMGHPLRFHPSARDYRRLNRRRVMAAHRELLSRGASTIVVVGDVTPDAILPILQRMWSGVGGVEVGTTVPAPVSVGNRVAVVHQAGSERAGITVSVAAPGLWTKDWNHAELANRVFGGEFTSRLNTLLRETLGLTYGVTSELRGWLGHGRLVVHCNTRVEDTARVMNTIRDVMQALGTGSPTEAELVAARNAVYRDAAQAMAIHGDLSQNLVSLATQGQPADGMRTRLAQMAASDAASVGSVAGGLFGGGDTVWLVMADRDRVRSQLDAAGWSVVRSWSNRDVLPPR